MVYRGRPSASCFACRSRRIKCDRLKPNCTQCSRMHVECPGYRDPLDQNFRDESESVIKRAQKSYKTRNGTTAEEKACKWMKNNIDLPFAKTGHVQTYDVFHDDLQLSLGLVRLAQPIQDVAVPHFMSSYVPASHFDYLPFMCGQVATNMALSSTIHATSIANLAWNIRKPDLMNMARRSYVQALLDTNAALADPLAAVEDATLVSVMLLGLFEAIAWSGSHTPNSWTTHTRGALALIKLRGPHQFETKIGRQLFIQVANIISVNSMQRKVRLPAELLELIAVALQHQAECPKYQLACLTGEVSDLLANIDEGGMSANSIVEATRQLEERYIVYAANLQPPWDYQKTTVSSSHSEVFGSTVHQYSSYRAAGLWNSYRMTRILLNEIIHAYSTCMPMDLAVTIQKQAVDNIQRMAIDICASIPQFTNIDVFPVSLGVRSPCSQPVFATPRVKPTLMKASAASVLWPLSVVRSASLASLEVREYAIERLRKLGREYHVPQAERLTIKGGETSALQNGLHMFYVS